MDREVTAVRRYRFRARERLRLARDFDRVFRVGRRFGHAALGFRFARSGLPYPRLGLAVGRSVGGSVRRNRVKRWIREAFRLAKGRIDPPVDIVVVARPGAHSFEGARRAFEALASHVARERGRKGGEGRCDRASDRRGSSSGS